VGVARTSHTICQFPNFITLTNHTKVIIYDDEAKNEMEAKQENEFFKDFCTINNNILETMTKEMKLLVDKGKVVGSLNPSPQQAAAGSQDTRTCKNLYIVQGSY
jgi:hypothetical protein